MPKWRQYWVLTKPRVTQLAVFCAVIGMFLATPGMVPYRILIGGVVGIWLLAGAAFAVNCLIEQVVDAKMRRTSWRPSATGELSPYQIIVFSIVLGSVGMVVLRNFTNPLTYVAYRCHLCGVCSYLHLALKACHPTKYCHWRFIWRDAPSAWLGGSNEYCFS